MKKQCNHTLESNNYNIRAHFLYCPRMNSFKYNLSNSSAEVTGCTFIFKILLHLFYYCFCYTYTYKIIVCSSMQRQRKHLNKTSSTCSTHLLRLLEHGAQILSWCFHESLGPAHLGPLKKRYIDQIQTSTNTQNKRVCKWFGFGSLCAPGQGCELHVSRVTGLLAVPHRASG